MAGLSFPEPVVHLSAFPGQKSVTATFPFTNETSEAIEIRTIKSSCGCTTPKLSKTTYAPEESGEIQAIFEIGERTGLQRKALAVQYRDRALEPQMLVLEVNIQQPVDFSKTILLWEENNQEPQTIDITVIQEAPLEIVTIQSDSPHYSAEVKTIKPGKQFQLTITPHSPSPGKATFTILTKTPSSKEPVPLPVKIRARSK